MQGFTDPLTGKYKPSEEEEFGFAAYINARRPEIEPRARHLWLSENEKKAGLRTQLYLALEPITWLGLEPGSGDAIFEDLGARELEKYISALGSTHSAPCMHMHMHSPLHIIALF